MKKQYLSLVLAGIAMLSTTAQANDFFDPADWYVAPFGTYVDTGGDRNADWAGWGAGMGIGKVLDEHFNVELRGFYQEFGGYNNFLKPTAKGDWQLAGGTADVQYYFFRDKFSPYAVLGIGGMNTEVPRDSGASFIGETGVGFTYELFDRVSLRSDVRYRYNNNFNAHFVPGTDEYHDMTVNVGLVIPLGEKAKPVEERVEEPAPAVVADCSTMDSDGDGVNNCEDKCPGTMAGSQVSDIGCPLRIELKGVQFRLDSAELTENSKTILDEVANSLISFPQSKDIEVQGHTSSEGSDAYNMKLSQRRSQSVADYLKMKGVPNRLYAKGYGESHPIADNSTEAGRSRNRRVELVWME